MSSFDPSAQQRVSPSPSSGSSPLSPPWQQWVDQMRLAWNNAWAKPPDSVADRYRIACQFANKLLQAVRKCADLQSDPLFHELWQVCQSVTSELRRQHLQLLQSLPQAQSLASQGEAPHPAAVLAPAPSESSGGGGPRDRYVFRRNVYGELGQSKFVWFAQRAADNLPVTVKLYRKPLQPAANDHPQREVDVMRTLISHRNIVHLLDFYADEDPEWYWIVMEQARDKDMFAYIELYSNQTLLSDSRLLRFYARQIVSGLQHMHVRGFAHCDVKLENVLLTHDEEGRPYRRLMLCDFGASRRWCEMDPVTQLPNPNRPVLSTESCGTVMYMAPEIYRGRNFPHLADVFGLGVLLLVCYIFSAPWSKSVPQDGEFQPLWDAAVRVCRNMSPPRLQEAEEECVGRYIQSQQTQQQRVSELRAAQQQPLSEVVHGADSDHSEFEDDRSGGGGGGGGDSDEDVSDGDDDVEMKDGSTFGESVADDDGEVGPLGSSPVPVVEVFRPEPHLPAPAALVKGMSGHLFSQRSDVTEIHRVLQAIIVSKTESRVAKFPQLRPLVEAYVGGRRAIQAQSADGSPSPAFAAGPTAQLPLRLSPEDLQLDEVLIDLLAHIFVPVHHRYCLAQVIRHPFLQGANGWMPDTSPSPMAVRP